MPRLLQRRSGMSLLEVLIILVVLAILTGAMVPTLLRTMRTTKLQRAESETCAIKDAVVNMLNDVDPGIFLQDGSAEPADYAYVQLLVGDGDIPELGTDGSAGWIQGVNFAERDFLAYHISTNQPGNDPARAYSGWNGPYMAGPIHPDPWGNRYMVNVGVQNPDDCHYDLVVLSAGPDEEVDSLFYQDGFVAGDDDIICLISGDSCTALPPGLDCEITICNDDHDRVRIYVNDVLQEVTILNGECHTFLLKTGDRVDVWAFPGNAPGWDWLEEFTVTDCGSTRRYGRGCFECDLCNEGEEPYRITYQYTGESCDATSTAMEPTAYSCSGDPAFADPVYIDAESDTITWSGWVPLNGTFVLDADSAGEQHLSDTTTFYIRDGPGGTLLQEVSYHTSCSQPIIDGDQFGSLIQQTVLTR